MTERIMMIFFRQFKYVIENMRNPLKWGFIFRAIDTSKEAFWCDKVGRAFAA